VVLQDAAEKEPVGQVQVFRDTQKRAGFHTPTEQQAYFVTKLIGFLNEGGDPTDIKDLTLESLKDVPSGQLCEYVVDGYDNARLATVIDGKPSPGHTLLAKGGDALTAGTLVVDKDLKGEITRVLVGTFSGHFRSGIEAQQHLVRHLVALGIPLEKIVQREGQAGNPRTGEILARLLGTDGAIAQREELEFVATAHSWDDFTAPVDVKKTPDQQAAAKERKANNKALQEALFGLRRALTSNMGSTMALAHDGDTYLQTMASTLLATFATGLVSSNRLVVSQTRDAAMRLLERPNVDDKTRSLLLSVLERINEADLNTHQDPVRVLSPEPTSTGVGLNGVARRTRVMATINPKVTDVQLQHMMSAGMNIARFNTAHGSVDEIIDVIRRTRVAAATVGKPVSIQIDLEGPKLRLGKFANPKGLEFNDIVLTQGQKVTLTSKDVLGNASLLPVAFSSLASDVKPGQPIFLNDGLVKLTVTSTNPAAGTVEADVSVGGKVWDNKGINLPQSNLSAPTITELDLANLTALLPHVDLVAPSFVRTADDITFLRERMNDLGRVVPILAKIERPEAVANLDEIAFEADGLMVARGDLGVEIGFENVPEAERDVISVGHALGKPVVVATEVLPSMAKESRPTHAESAALFAAVADLDVEAVMLGKETSFAKDPGETIRAAVLLINRAELYEKGGVRINHQVDATPKPPFKRQSPLQVRISQG
jgi:pyruvate kinase